jgi:transposase
MSDNATEFAENVLMDSHTASHMATRGPRIQVITRPERRRKWSDDQKREIVAESLSSGASASAVARKHDVNPGQLFTWRRQLLAGGLDSAAPSPAGFARVDVVSSPCLVKSERPICPDNRADDAGPVVATNKGSSGAMEIVFNGVTLRVDASVDSAALRKVLAALGRR